MITVTSTSLLDGLRNTNNDQVWTDFFNRYQPLLVAFGRRMGLNEQDAQDASQESLLAFVNAYREGGYDREKGRLRTWLYGIASHKVRDIQRRRGRQRVVADNADTTRFLNKVPDDRTMTEVWEAEWARSVLKACLDEVRRHVKPQTMEAFELFALQGWPAGKVAEHLKMSENAVWIAKNRVLTRMRKIQAQLEEEW